MDTSKNFAGGVKVTYIETQFVTSDAAGFKDLVQRLTGRSAEAAGAGTAADVPDQVPQHGPRGWRADGGGLAAAAAAAPQGCHYTTSPAGTLGLGGAHAQVGLGLGLGLGLEEQELHEMGVFSDLFYDAASIERCLEPHGTGGGRAVSRNLGTRSEV